MIRLTRRYRFSASHRLHSPHLSPGQNEALYGKCNHPYGHGHDYVLDVTVEGPLDEASGRMCDLATFDGLLTRYVVGDLDHKNLNEDVPEFKSMVPTSENLAAVIEDRLRRAWSTAFGEWPRLSGIRLRETRRNLFERKI